MEVVAIKRIDNFALLIENPEPHVYDLCLITEKSGGQENRIFLQSYPSIVYAEDASRQFESFHAAAKIHHYALTERGFMNEAGREIGFGIIVDRDNQDQNWEKYLR